MKVIEDPRDTPLPENMQAFASYEYSYEFCNNENAKEFGFKKVPLYRIFLWHKKDNEEQTGFVMEDAEDITMANSSSKRKRSDDSDEESENKKEKTTTSIYDEMSDEMYEDF